MEDSVDRIITQWAQVHPQLNVTAMGVLGRLSRLTRIFELDMQKIFSEHRLRPGEFDILATLRRADADGTGLTAGQLSESAMVTSGAITNRIDRLLFKQLITRETDPHSRRTIRIALTPRGREVVDAALRDHIDNQEGLLSTLTLSQRDQLEGLLRVLLHDYEGRG
ncbi:MarR family winged helix-turn-helix transcriptional regulator [Cryobacterium sp. W22_MBD10_FK3]|uniref:MarR family winged helix-turn-helix transcriptional regulator n=1 Tax=Cryobacterium sp. W22_MBD10_FK3 TaxID=3240273 RepID=UPI003F936E64